jgi:NAD(P)-dependent dehydrogenase (short-subunit alcohol dehydrogenase family)
LVSGRDAERGASCVERIRTKGGRAEFLAVDLGGSYAGIRSCAAEATVLLGGRTDVLVNNAGLYSKAADEQLAHSWAAEFGSRGVRFNTMAPASP